MGPSILLLMTLFSLAFPSLATRQNICGNYASMIEGLTQGGYRFAHAINTNNATLLRLALAPDVHYDSTDLGPGYGGVVDGREATIAAIQAGHTAGVKMSALVTNLLLLELQTATRARVLTSITRSHWDSAALDDLKKTYRFFYECDDIWVCQGEFWALKHSVVRNMGPGVEGIYNAQVVVA